MGLRRACHTAPRKTHTTRTCPSPRATTVSASARHAGHTARAAARHCSITCGSRPAAIASKLRKSGIARAGKASGLADAGVEALVSLSNSVLPPWLPWLWLELALPTPAPPR